MVTDFNIPPAIEIPVEGCSPLVFDRSSMTHDVAWLRLALGKDMTLERPDFVNEDDFFKYFLVACGLLDYACVIIHGNEGGGKSLCQAVLTYQILRLFPEKKGTLDWSPPKRTIYLTSKVEGYVSESEEEGKLIKYIEENSDESGLSLSDFCDYFGINMDRGKFVIGELQIKGLVKLDTVPEFKRCNRLLDSQVAEKLEEDLNKTSEYEDEIPPQVLNNLLVYNRVFGCDECDKWGDKSNRTKFTLLMSRLINRRRHYHTTFLFVYIDKNRVDQSLIWDRRTHTIFSQKVDNDLCEYTIKHERTGTRHKMYLHPSEWVRLWDTHNISAVSHNVKGILGGKVKKKKEASQEE